MVDDPILICILAALWELNGLKIKNEKQGKSGEKFLEGERGGVAEINGRFDQNTSYACVIFSSNKKFNKQREQKEKH